MAWTHRLTNIDSEARTATCANCGPVKVKPKQNGWRCFEAEKQWRGPKFNRPYTQFKQESCARCGFQGHRCQMDVDHVDGNHKNNDPSNLQTLCANCHRLKTMEETQAPR